MGYAHRFRVAYCITIIATQTDKKHHNLPAASHYQIKSVASLPSTSCVNCVRIKALVGLLEPIAVKPSESRLSSLTNSTQFVIKLGIVLPCICVWYILFTYLLMHSDSV